MAGANTLEFTDDNFDSEVIGSDRPVMVDFWAEWCPPCKALGPTIDELADEYAGKVKVGKVNTEKCPRLSTQFAIQHIPAVLLFEDGQLADTLIGLRSKRDLKQSLDYMLS
jgi:thioredoxin 1